MKLNNKIKALIYYIKNILFILTIFSMLYLLMPSKTIGLLGTIFQITFIIYVIVEIIVIILKQKEISKNTIRNILSIFLYFYFILLAYRYKDAISYEVISNKSYCFINILIMEISILIIMFYSFMIRNVKKENKD